jgi:glucosylglycerate synthase
MTQPPQQADLLVGIPTYNSAATIEPVTRAIVAGLTKYFPDAVAVMLNADCGSHDGTPAIWDQLIVPTPAKDVIAESAPRPEKTLLPLEAVADKRAAYKLILQRAQDLKVSACAIVDPDVRSIEPEWIDALLAPVTKDGYDYVAPLYRRHKYDGTITNSILYPLTAALYGKRLRQPIGGDFGLSPKLAAHCLGKNVWNEALTSQGIDLWMTTIAAADSFRVCQAFLGPKVPVTKGHEPDLPTMLAAVVGTAFLLMEQYQARWMEIRHSENVPTFGMQFEQDTQSAHVQVDRMVKALRQGLRDLLPVWEIILSEDALAELVQLGWQDPEDFRFPDDLWVRIIYDFALGYHEQVLHRDHLLKSLTPLYLGKTASFILETRTSSSAQIAENIESLCRQFEGMKSYLMERWR